MNITERINRILFILSYVSQNQGISIGELADRVGMRPNQLVKELEFISLIGKPPFKPDDYIDIYVDDQQVFIEFDQKLNRPLRFTRPEAMALLMSLELLDSEVDPTGVRSLKKKIGELISRSVDEEHRLQEQIVLERPSRLVSESFRAIRRGIEEKRKLEIDYYSLTRDQTEARTIRPYFLMKYLGYWYLTGYCELRQDLRTFKFERILSTRLMGERFQSTEEFDVDGYKENFLKSMGSHVIRIRFSQEVAPWIKEQWGDAVQEGEDGSVILTLESETLEYPTRLVLGAAPHALPVSPPEFIDHVKQIASELSAQYASNPVVS